MCNASSTSSDVCSHASNFFPCVVAKEPKQKPQFHFTPSPLLRRSHVPLIDLVQTTGHIKKEQRCHLLGVIHRTLFKHLFLPRTILLFFHRGGIQSASRRFWKRQEKGLFFFSWPSPLIISVGLAKIARGHGRPLGLKLPIAVNQFRAVRGSAAHTLPYSVIEYRLIDSRLLHSSFFSLSRVFTWATWVPQHLLEQWAASATWQIRGSSYLNETKMASNPQKFHLGN